MIDPFVVKKMNARDQYSRVQPSLDQDRPVRRSSRIDMRDQNVKA
jgi:hypothetical protein